MQGGGGGGYATPKKWVGSLGREGVGLTKIYEGDQLKTYLLHLGHILNGTAYCDTQLDCIFALQEGFSLVDIVERLRILPKQKSNFA